MNSKKITPFTLLSTAVGSPTWSKVELAEAPVTGGRGGTQWGDAPSVAAELVVATLGLPRRSAASGLARRICSELQKPCEPWGEIWVSREIAARAAAGEEPSKQAAAAVSATTAQTSPG
jgi:hypothetical protein